MRVALVCGTYDPTSDGVADYVRRLAQELRAGGTDVVVAARQAGAVGDGTAGTGEPAVVAVTPRWSLRHLRGTARGLDDLRADLVHVQFAPSAFGYSPAVGWLPALLRTPVVTTLHEYGWWSYPGWVPDPVWDRLERGGRFDRETALLGPRSRALVVTNPGHAGTVASRLGRRPDVVPIGPNVPGPGPDAAGAAARVRARYEVPAGVPLLVFFGFVHPVKGVRELADAVGLLRDGGRDVHVVVAGGFASLALPGAEADSFRREVEERIARARVGDRFRLTGWVDGSEVSELLSAADAVVLPFTHGVTTKSGSLLAALAHGRPVLATAADDPDPELADGGTVLTIARRRDPGAIADAIRRLLDDPAGAARAAAAGAALAATRDWPMIAAAHADLYARVLGR